ncbi:uncharacterized protein LOC127729977 [Mytilus californianus]|uniref:uncharacterized protein LOC127729977 n=1 Tax=Mytilus californianus TaxID=6549 RepID=UPI0022453AC0|nr:uncharacterized protein LOC127729977 [Mytilus californianus]
MSHNKAESLHFYKYLCHKIGSEEVVKARRLTLTSIDMTSSSQDFLRLSSGSKGEGLNLNGSDFDVMFIDLFFIVNESERVAVNDHDCVLVMETEDTQPCYTYLHLFTNYNILPHKYKQLLQQQSGKNLISSELYKLWMLNNFKEAGYGNLLINHMHGPCLSDKNDKNDLAFCLKCDQWVSQAQPWITRPRATWPSPELISKITLCGVLFVPIGYKGSRNEHLQWRISFSIAEKLLVYSFSHTQFLCYALLKILLKEIVDRNENLKGLLCSYFLKTLMFWISEETEPYIWRSDNIIPCFMVCLKRLLYCIEYSTLLHYFIPDNNLFHLRFNNKNRDTLINILKNSYIKGIKIFSSSETLHDYRRFHNEITRSESKNARLIQEIGTFFNTEMSLVSSCSDCEEGIQKVFITFLYHCRTEISKCIFTISLSKNYRSIPHKLQQRNNPNNKHQYNKYRHELSQLLVGSHSDAVSGWLKLASFFYVHKHYLHSIAIINYALSKCTNEIVYPEPFCTFIKMQECELKMIMQERLSSVWKKIIIQNVVLDCVVLPTELPRSISDNYETVFDPISFAHLLSSLTNNHLKDNISSRQSMLQFIDRQFKITIPEEYEIIPRNMFSNPNHSRLLYEWIATFFNILIKVL